MDNSVNALGRRIQMLRESNMMTRGDLAQNMGVTRRDIVDWEEGRVLPTAQQVIDVAKFFGADPRALLNVEETAPEGPQPTPPKAGKRLTAGILCLALGLCAALGAVVLMQGLSAGEAGADVPAVSEEAPLPEKLTLIARPAAEWDLDGDGEKELVCLRGQALFFDYAEEGLTAYALATPLADDQTLTAQDGVFILTDSSGRSRIYSVLKDGALWPAG